MINFTSQDILDEYLLKMDKYNQNSVIIKILHRMIELEDWINEKQDKK